MSTLLEKARSYVKIEAETRLKNLDLSAPPNDFIEAFLIQMEQVLCAVIKHVTRWWYCLID